MSLMNMIKGELRVVLKKMQLQFAQSQHMLNACKAELQLRCLDANTEKETLIKKIKSKEKEILNFKELSSKTYR